MGALFSTATECVTRMERVKAHNTELRHWVRALELQVRGIVVIWCLQAFLFGVTLSHWWLHRTADAAMIALAAGGSTFFGLCAERWARRRARQEQCTW